MKSSYHIAALVLAAAFTTAASAQNVTPGTTSTSESGQKPEGGAAMDSKASTGQMKSRSTKSKASSTSPMASASGASGAMGTDAMKSDAKTKMPKSPKGSTGTPGETPVKQ